VEKTYDKVPKNYSLIEMIDARKKQEEERERLAREKERVAQETLEKECPSHSA
jgi:hypothetical protein